MTPEAVRHYLRELGGHNLGEVTSPMVEELLLYPGACDTRHQLTVLQAYLRTFPTTGREPKDTTMDEAIRAQAELLAKLGAKNKGTESKHYMDGYADAVVFLAGNPMLVEMLAVLHVTPTPEPVVSPTGTEGS